MLLSRVLFYLFVLNIINYRSSGSPVGTSSGIHVDMTLMDEATHDRHELPTQSD